MKRILKRAQLLGGPYTVPFFSDGEWADCLYRDRECVITGWTGAILPWPKGIPVGGVGAPSIIVTAELERAVRCESALAIRGWFGVSVRVVRRWRGAFGVSRTNNDGTNRLVRAASELGAQTQRGQTLPPDQVERRRATAYQQNLGQYLQPGYHGPLWTEEQLALLGTLPDDDVAALVGRSANAVRVRREKLGIRRAGR